MSCQKMVATVALPYSRLATEYDATIGAPFFRETRDRFERLARKYGITFRSAADIGCGTGLFARYLQRSRKIPVFAVDLSQSMLHMAGRNCRDAEVKLLRQDIRYLTLPQPVDLITANFDTVNHLVKTGDLRQALGQVFANLNAGGHFIFDVVTNCLPIGRARHYRRRFDGPRRQVMQAVRLDPLKRLLSIVVSISSPETPFPIVERHQERVYSPAEVGGALREAGFIIRGVHDAVTLTAAQECVPRLVVVAQKK
ncbi:MAG TPA: class I SAM-dependent methyltransferase [Pyrinomonadaceae bacterium]|nr:class I SAM-dependent methyltransferase [Pyrinomonadaceae bacterium]